MWGYIDRTAKNIYWHCVPSLYVRVYRMVGKFRKRMNCSLIICEGISPQPIFQVAHQAFPHYMWGYIEYIKSLTWETSVPSLYVRVYRQPSITLLNLSRSLIICEGISYTRNAGGTETAFPHYMWGYIGAFSVGLQGSLVPSLYVRVYHGRDETPEPPRSSLIICEGISQRQGRNDA